MIQRIYSLDGGMAAERPMERKKLKRQPTIQSSEMDLSDISQNSLLCGMQQFDKAVQNMDETILVPSRLMDMSVRDESEKQKPLPSLLRSAEAYDVYRLLKSVRSQVRQGCIVEPEEPSTLQRVPSMLSSHSLSSLASDASSGGAAGDDSGHESEPTDGSDGSDGADDPCELVRARFEAHLSGLGQCLVQMTEAASFLSSRYEQQVNSGC